MTVNHFLQSMNIDLAASIGSSCLDDGRCMNWLTDMTDAHNARQNVIPRTEYTNRFRSFQSDSA